MKQILGEQRNRREKEERFIDTDNKEEMVVDASKEIIDNDENTNGLIAKLKRKYAEQNNKPKKARL